MDLSRLRKTLGLALALVVSASAVYAQSYETLVFFRDKVGSPYTVAQADLFLSPRSIARRAKFGISVTERDLPVSATYLSQLRAAGLTLGYTSKWLNAVSVIGDSATVVNALNLPFIVARQQIARRDAAPKPSRYSPHPNGIAATEVNNNYGIGLSQVKMLGIDSMHQAGYTGKGVLVGVLDAGYQGVDRHAAFTRLADSGRLADSRDFIGTRGSDVYAYHWHGGGALSCVGGYFPGFFIGGAYQASFALYVTEDVTQERPVEPFYWVVGAERADSLGVDIINTSLGYSTFDKTILNYTFADLDGQTTISTRGVNAATDAGILCVTSAGNEGQNFNWKGKISAPADAAKGLTVGALLPDSTIAPFSSRGFPGRQIKPDVVAQGVNCLLYSPNDPQGLINGSGTSFSAPQTAGLIAGMMQQFPNVSPARWIEALHRTSTRSNSPDTAFGYGIPNYGRLARYLSNVTGIPTSGKSLILFPNPQIRGAEVSFLLDTNEQVTRLSVVNYLGQEVGFVDSPKRVGTKIVLDTRKLAAGTYTVRATTSSGTHAGRLVVRE